MLVAEETISDYVNGVLVRRGISQAQLAAYVGASAPAVVDWLSGKRTPNAVNLWRLAKYDRANWIDLMRLAKHIPPDEDVPSGPDVKLDELPRGLREVIEDLRPHPGMLDALERSGRVLLEVREATSGGAGTQE